MKHKFNKYLPAIAIILFILIVLFIFYKIKKENFTDFTPHEGNFPEKTKAFYINLDKNIKRKNELVDSYNASDLKNIPLNRFSAIPGKTVDLDKWLTPEALKQVLETEKTNTRSHHYQLTIGAVGCFLSHYTLAKQLLDDNYAEYYLILEDDIVVNENLLNTIKRYLSTVPNDWDILQLSTLRNVKYTVVGEFYKPSGFWGMQSYIINKRGAKKLIDEVEKHKIDGQIDAYLSRMMQQGKIKIYITKQRLFFSNENGMKSDIQCKLIKNSPSDNPFNYKGYLV
jgi:GR25 family glycosyltransferase involved in LPS biosynthesis